MKKFEEKPSDVGVLVGRFQVDELHEGHVNLIQSVCELHPKVIIFLGLSPCMVSRSNPLDFESRKQMILEKFPKVNVLYVKDVNSDKIWSKNLDEKIRDLITPNQTVTLYGSRDSFISHYSGHFKTQELMQEHYISASEVRENIRRCVKDSANFRAGIIWAAYNQYPKVYPTVDIAVVDKKAKKILLVRKPTEEQFRLVGGFAEPNSESYEEDAKREVMEETGLEVEDLTYVGSFKVSDWRYKGVDKIKTILFLATYVFGNAVANDDVCEAKWFDIKNFDMDNVMDLHKEMVKKIIEKIS